MEVAFDQARGAFAAQAATGRFLFTQCGECGRWMWPPVGPCPTCDQDTLEWAEVAGTGTVGGRCEVHRGMDPPFAAETPYVIVVVDLDEGFPFITRTAADLKWGDRARLEWADVQDKPWPCAVADDAR